MTVILYLILSPLLLLIAVVLKKIEPTSINMNYGYRSKRSMVNEETWRVGNQFASNLLIYIAVGLNVWQAIVFLIWPSDTGFLIVAGSMVLAMIAIIPMTESHLRKQFDRETFE